MDAVNATKLPDLPPVDFHWTWPNMCRFALGLLGILGNSLVIAVYCGKRKQKNSTNVLILALACADLISSVNFIPLPVLRDVPPNVWGEIYCRVVFTQSLLFISIEASVYTLTVLSAERYLAVVHPIRYRSVFVKSWPKRFVWIVWVFAVAVKSFNFYQTVIEEGRGCVVVSFPAGLNLVIAVGVAVIEYFVPIAVMVVCNVCTVRALRAQARNLQGHRAAGGGSGGGSNPESGPALSVLRTRRRVIHVVLIVIITFIVCWTPNQISFLLINVGVLPASHFGSSVHQAFTILAFFNSCANPIIYTFKNKQFRASVGNLFRAKSGRVADSTVVSDPGATALAGGVQPVIAAVSSRTTKTAVQPFIMNSKPGATPPDGHASGSANSAEGIS